MSNLLGAANTSKHRFEEQDSAPPTPAATFIQLYFADDKKLKSLDSDALIMNYAGTIATQTDDATIVDTVTETTLFGTVVGTLTLPADLLIAGRTIRITMRGHISTTGTPNITIRSNLGGTEVVGTGATAVGTVSSVGWTYTVDITCRSTGGSGTVVAAGLFSWDDGSVQNSVKTGTTTIDTTGTLAVDITAEWGTASASNTITAQIASVEVIN